MFPNSKFLSYKQTVIWRSDLGILQERIYLSDNIIEFYFARLSSIYQSNEILLVPPAISFLLAKVPDLESFLSVVESLNLREKNLIFFVVNDNSKPEASDGGSHWSLLVYCRRWNQFMHYDTCNWQNNGCAFNFYELIKRWVSDDVPQFVERRAPRQRNTYDCGLYVMEIARVICGCYLDGECEVGGFFNVMRRVSVEYVESEMRTDLLRLILSFKKEQSGSQ